MDFAFRIIGMWNFDVATRSFERFFLRNDEMTTKIIFAKPQTSIQTIQTSKASALVLIFFWTSSLTYSSPSLFKFEHFPMKGCYLLLSTLSMICLAFVEAELTGNVAQIDGRNLIVGGNVVPSNDGVSQDVYPYLVSFRYEVTSFLNITDPFMNENGGGVLIKATNDALIVLTANVQLYEGEKAYIGAYDISRAAEELEEFTIESVESHPDILNRVDDVSSSLILIKLSKPSDPTRYTPITNFNYNASFPSDGTAVTVMGHGQTTAGNFTGVSDEENNIRINEINVLHDVELSYLSAESCKTFNAAQGTTLDFEYGDTFCLVSAEPKSNCFGDGGSPAIIKGTEDPADDILLGFVFLMNGPYCGVVNQTDVYQSIASYKDWIEETAEMLLGPGSNVTTELDDMTMPPTSPSINDGSSKPAPMPNDGSGVRVTMAGCFVLSLAAALALI